MRNDLLNRLSVDNVMRDARFFAEETPHRLSGTENECKAAEYMKAQFEAAGVPMTLHELDAWVSFPGKAVIEVLGPEPRTIEAMTFAQSAPTPPEGIEGELVHVGPGGLTDYDGKDAAGRISLAELSYAPPRPEKLRIAARQGAIGQIMMNWGLPEHDTLPMGTCKPVWGNPTPGNFGDMPTIPAVGVRLKDGMWLAEQTRKGPVRIRIHANVENRWARVIQPMALIEGNEEADKFVVVGGHYDAWGPAASDNAAGNAEVIEIARVLAGLRGKLRRSVLFTFWAAHESGIMAGSSWFADRYWDQIDRGGILYLNVDSVAMQGSTHFQAATSYQTVDLGKRLGKDVLGIADMKTSPVARTGDQAFFGIGMPAVYASHKHSPEQQREWRGATLGWWYHSDKDTMERVDPALLADSLKMHLAYTLELADAPLLPFRIGALAEVLAHRSAELAALAPKDLDLDALRGIAEALHQRAEAFDSAGAAVATAGEAAQIAWNDTAMRLNRQLTPVASTVSGRWDQDSYGLTALGSLIPGLKGIEHLARLSPEEDSYKLQWTELRRQRNRAADGLREAVRTIDAYFSAPSAAETGAASRNPAPRFD